jgi:hypothetical protein
MGGYRSGRWGGHRKKTTVEESLVLTADSLRPLLAGGRGSAGTLTFDHGKENFSLTETGMMEKNSEADLRVRYPVGSGENAREVDYYLRMVKTSPRIGGPRWYFLCPLMVDGKPCLRRVLKLYRPPGQIYFGCRTCYRLTYTSSQESHKFDSLYKHLAASVGRGMTARDVKAILNERKP